MKINTLKNNGLKILSLALLAMIVSGCASSVRTQLNTFMAPDTAFGEGTIAVKAVDEQLQDSLEFALYRSKLEARLRNLGYTLAEPEEAAYIARLGYRVDEVQEQLYQPDVYFTTGFGRYYRRGGIGFMIDDRPDYREAYVRVLNLSITRAAVNAGDEPRRVYEVTAASQGSCPIVSVVFDEMLAAIFQNFPGDNGAVKSVTVRGDAGCR